MSYGNYSNNPHDASNPLSEKTGRVREVFDTDMVIHVWAQNTQARGRNAKGSCYFEHGTLYSYGSHYVMGHHMPDGVVLLNDDSSSVTTNAHRWKARRAVDHKTAHAIPSLTELLPTYWSPLRILAQSDRSKEDKTRAKAQIAAFVAKHALGLADDAGAYLLRVAGLSPSKAATRLASLRKAALAVKAKADATAKANAEKRARMCGKQFAGMSDREWRRALGDAPAYRLDDWVKEMRRCVAALKRANAPRKAAILAARVKTAQADYNMAYRSVRRMQANQSRLSSVQTIRQFVAALSNSALVADEYYKWRGLIDAFTYVRKATPRLAELLATAERMRDEWYTVEEARQAAERAERVRLATMKEEERRAEWFAGNPASRWSGRDELGGAYLRVVGDELQTSQGASVPLAHAIRAFRFIKLCRNRAAEWSRNGRVIRVGHFTVDHIKADGSFKAGCHEINWPEIERIARAIGVYDAAPDSEALEPSNPA